MRRRGPGHGDGRRASGLSIRVVQVSDTHLSGRRGYGVANFDALVAAINADPPDLVVATGDLALDDPDDADDRAFARARFDRLLVPWRAIPGNHDIGDDGPVPWMGEPVTEQRRDAWLGTWGADWWVEDVGEWLVVGLNALLMGSGLSAEEAQWAWLSAVVAGAGGRPVMVAIHKPMSVVPSGGQRALVPGGRRRLGAALAHARVRLVVSGHVHQYRLAAEGDAAVVWAPSTCFVSRGPSPFGGVKTVGAVDYRLDGSSVTWGLLRPPGMVDHVIDELAGGAESLRWAPLHPVP